MNTRIKRLGIFDSGIGGLSILHALLPLVIPEFVYVADTANMPYGEKSPEHIQQLCIAVTEFLIKKRVDAIVIACHTACTAALPLLQKKFPDMLFIEVINGTVEQAIKETSDNIIGVIGTQSTIDSGVYSKKIGGIKNDIRVIEKACPQLASLIEHSLADTHSIEHSLKIYLTPLVIRNIDTLIIGCTHYIFIQQLIQKIIGPRVVLVNAQQSVKKQIIELIGTDEHTNSYPVIELYVTGDKNLFLNPYAPTINYQPQQLLI